MSINARDELLSHIRHLPPVTHVDVTHGNEFCPQAHGRIRGSLEDVLPLLDFEYDNGFGMQELYGHVWYADGTWSDRYEYDGAEDWVYRSRPDIPDDDTNPQPEEPPTPNTSIH